VILIVLRRSILICGLALVASPWPDAHAGRASRSQACADRMAEFAESAPILPIAAKKIELTAKERANAAVIRRLCDPGDANWSRDYYYYRDHVVPELRKVMKETPELLRRDPDTALRFAVAVLLKGTWQERALEDWLVESGLRFEGATLSKAEVQEIVGALKSYQPMTTYGFLGRWLTPIEEMAATGPAAQERLRVAFERKRARAAYSFFQALSSQSDAATKKELLSYLRLHARDRHAALYGLDRAFETAAPFRTRESGVWKRALERALGATDEPLAVAHVLEDGRIRVSASDPFDGAKPGDLGFERIFKPSDLRSLADSEGVLLREETFGGGFRISRSVLDELQQARKIGNSVEGSPPYSAWARDGKIQGLVFTDTGFEAKDARETLDEYLAFYRGEGFQFKKQSVSDFPEWIESRVRSGELDYLVREGHEVKNLKMARSGDLMIGRKAGKPPQEVVLFIPNTGSAKSELSWATLNQALVERSASAPENSLLYFDTKCHSFKGTACELPNLAKTSQIQVVSSSGVASTFVNDDASPLRALMQGILEQDNYAQMESRLKAARKRAGASGQEDQYVLPNSYAYRTEVLEKDSPGGPLEWVEK
jgi:hypothetical protein